MTDEESVAAVEELRARIDPAGRLTLPADRLRPAHQGSAEQSEKDLQQAETVSLPIAALILILVFALAASPPACRSLVAGPGHPHAASALIYLVAQQVEMSIYVLNIATMLGLALAIDYSLFIVSRFREELRRGRTVAEAVERAVATTGKAVAFSGLAVAIGLSGLLLFEAPAIRSIGIGGSLVVLLLGVLRTDVPARRPRHARPPGQRAQLAGLARRRLRPLGRPSARPPRPASRWERVAHGVMRRPVAGPGPDARLPARSPARRSCASSRASRAPTIYPPGLESRDAYVALADASSRAGETTPIVVLADVDGSPDRPGQRSQALPAYAAAIDALDGSTASRARSPRAIPRRAPS